MTGPAPPVSTVVKPGSRALPIVEWFSETAYTPPGAHRLLTAAGLTAGLLIGRGLMDVVTARSSNKEKPLERDQVLAPFTPLHGLMRYNPYSDRTPDRWKSVVDNLAPVMLGGVGAYLGSRHYFYGNELKLWGNGAAKAFNATTKSVSAKFKTGTLALDEADHMTGLVQSETMNKPAAFSFIWGSDTGFHLPGAWWVFGTGMSAERFATGVGRKPWIPFAGWFNRLMGNHSSGMLSLHGAMRDTAKWMEANVMKFSHPEKWLTSEALMKRVEAGLQVFRKVTPEQKQKLMKAFEEHLQKAHALREKLKAAGKSEEEISKKVYEFIGGTGEYKDGVGLFGVAYERMLIQNGFDLTKVKLGDFGPFTFVARLLGGGKGPRAVEAAYAKHLKEAHGIEYGESYLHDVTLKKTAYYTGFAGLTAAGIYAGDKIVTQLNKKVDAAGNPDTQNAEPEKQKGKGINGWVNGKPLDTLQWASRMLITPPSMHRFMNAAFLSGTLYGSAKFANVLAGRKLQLLRSGALPNSLVSKEQVWGIFKPLHGILEYTPGSSLLKDRWRQAAHALFPVSVGMFGTFTGSHMFFRDRINSLKKPETLEDYVDKISLEQSKFYAGATAFTSIFNTGSGIHLLPIFSYTGNLNNRYLAASGQQVALPGLGKWWSGNPGLHPWGVKQTLGHLCSYLTYNPDKNPHEVPLLVHSVIAKLYPDLPEDKLLVAKRKIIDRLMGIRNEYFEGDTIPEKNHKVLHERIHQLTGGQGFEELLMHAGLNPAEANLAHNGMQGKIANWTGSGRTVDRLQNEYRSKFAERMGHRGRPFTAQHATPFASGKKAEIPRGMSGNGVPGNKVSVVAADRLQPSPGQFQTH